MIVKAYMYNYPGKPFDDVIVQVFNETFSGGDELFFGRTYASNDRFCILNLIKTRKDDIDYNLMRKNWLTSCKNKQIIGYKNHNCIRYNYRNDGTYDELKFDKDLYEEHKQLIAQKRSQLGKEPKLIDLVRDRLKKDPVAEDWDLEHCLTDAIKSGEASRDWQALISGKMCKKDFFNKYNPMLRLHMYALAILSSLPKPEYSKLKSAGPLVTLDAEW